MLNSNPQDGMPSAGRGLGRPRVGEVLGSKYEILRLIGEGGMGAVFEAENRITQKRVAIKWLHPELSSESGAAARLVREAQAASRVRHSNVVDVYDVERDGHAIFLVMELLDGETLTRVLARRDLPVPALIALLLPAMRGVAAAHRQGVIHRDVKPDNIFLAHEDGSSMPVAKVLDFGISKLEERGRSQPSLTRTGSAVGTPLYMSYEQLSSDRAIDGRADVYAFGVILYEALTGRMPFEANSLPKLVVKIATQVPVPPRELCPELPESLSRLVMRALARQRDDRTPNMEALIAELTPFANEHSYQAELHKPSSVLVDSVRPAPQAVEPQFLGQTTQDAATMPGRLRAEPLSASPTERPFPLLGRSERLRRYQPIDDGASAELRAQSLATPPRSTFKRTHVRPLRLSLLVGLPLSAAAALLFQLAHSPAESATPTSNVPTKPAARSEPVAPSLPSAPATRASSKASDDDWGPGRTVQLLPAESAAPDAGSSEVSEPRELAPPRRSEPVRRERAQRRPSAHVTEPATPTPPSAPAKAQAPVESKPAQPENKNPFRVNPPRSEEF